MSIPMHSFSMALDCITSKSTGNINNPVYKYFKEAYK